MQILSILYAGLSTASVSAGIGRHSYDLSSQEISQAIRLNSIAFVPGMLSLAIPKLGVACLLERLLSPKHGQKWRRPVLFTLSISCVVIAVLCSIMFWAQCRPAAGLWNIFLEKDCWNPSVYIDLVFFGSGNSVHPSLSGYMLKLSAWFAFVDLFLALYPMTVVLKLNMSMKKKIGCSCVLGLGVALETFSSKLMLNWLTCLQRCCCRVVQG